VKSGVIAVNNNAKIIEINDKINKSTILDLTNK
jgi:hypothetical protein